MELIQQLNEVVKDKDGIERPKLHRVIKNLITQATTAADEYARMETSLRRVLVTWPRSGRYFIASKASRGSR
jgi:hypothetical protein